VTQELLRFCRQCFRVAFALALIAILALLIGCGQKEDKPPPGYYEGPMKPKGTLTGQGAAGTDAQTTPAPGAPQSGGGTE